MHNFIILNMLLINTKTNYSHLGFYHLSAPISCLIFGFNTAREVWEAVNQLFVAHPLAVLRASSSNFKHPRKAICL